MDFPDGSVVNNSRVRALGWEDPLEKEIAPHSGILAWEIPLPEEPGGSQTLGSQRVEVTAQLNDNNKGKQFEATTYLSLFVEDLQRSFTGEGDPRVRLGCLGG